MRYLRLKHPNYWLAGLLVLQILLTVVAFYTFVKVGRTFPDWLEPTPSCPYGIQMPFDSIPFNKCLMEKVTQYIPAWMIPVAQLATVGVLLCIVSGFAIWSIRPLDGDAKWVKAYVYPTFQLIMIAGWVCSYLYLPAVVVTLFSLR